MEHTTEKGRSPNTEMIAAGEVGRYVFCPEAWRLSRFEKVRGSPTEASVAGEAEHDRWGTTVDQLESIRVGLRVLFGLSIVACLLCQWGGR